MVTRVTLFVEACRLSKALAVRGLALSIGFLHSDKKGRNSLVLDAIETLRSLGCMYSLDFIKRGICDIRSRLRLYQVFYQRITPQWHMSRKR
jgi:CRISPR associated protein Cas1